MKHLNLNAKYFAVKYSWEAFSICSANVRKQPIHWCINCGNVFFGYLNGIVCAKALGHSLVTETCLNLNLVSWKVKPSDQFTYWAISNHTNWNALVKAALLALSASQLVNNAVVIPFTSIYLVLVNCTTKEPLLTIILHRIVRELVLVHYLTTLTCPAFVMASSRSVSAHCTQPLNFSWCFA